MWCCWFRALGLTLLMRQDPFLAGNRESRVHSPGLQRSLGSPERLLLIVRAGDRHFDALPPISLVAQSLGHGPLGACSLHSRNE